MRNDLNTCAYGDSMNNERQSQTTEEAESEGRLKRLITINQWRVVTEHKQQQVLVLSYK